MEIESSNFQGTDISQNFQQNLNADNSSNQTNTVSTKDNLSAVSSNSISPVIVMSSEKKDLFKLCQLVLKERQALSNNASKLASKPSFREIKTNVQIIQHNIDNFFCISGKKALEKLKKDD